MGLTLPEKISRWLSSKSPPKSRFVLSQKNIYIFPTKSGFAFLALLLLMLITAINYQNSLIYLMLFFLGVVFVISIWMCFLNLAGLEIASRDVGFCFESEDACFLLHLSAKKGVPLGLYVGLTSGKLHGVNFNHENVTVSIPVSGLKRGRHRCERIRLESAYPFGFIKAWTWLRTESTVIVYPKKVRAPRVATSNSLDDHDAKLSESQPDDEIKAYVAGDNSKRIVWKKYAAQDSLVVRKNVPTSISNYWLRLTDYEASDAELRLQHLCYDVCQYSESNVNFGLELPGTTIPVGEGEMHQAKCLELLATYDIDNNTPNQI